MLNSFQLVQYDLSSTPLIHPDLSTSLDSRLRGYGGALSAKEKEVVRRFLDEARKTSDAYDRVVRQALADRNAFEATVMQYRSLVAPVRSLPDEILRDIFLYTVVDSNWFGVGDRWCSGTLVLASVCAKWRQLTMNYMELWSTFGVDISCRNAFEPVKLFLDRSGDQPLHIYLDGRFHLRTDVGSTMLDLLSPSYPRWVFMALNEVEVKIGRFPNLVDACCILRYANNLVNAPRLTRLRLTYDAEGQDNVFPQPSIEGGVPFSQLEQLVVEHGQGWGVAATIDMLRRCPALRVLVYTYARKFLTCLYERLPRHELSSEDRFAVPISSFCLRLNCTGRTLCTILRDFVSRVTLRSLVSLTIESTLSIDHGEVQDVEVEGLWPGSLVLSALDVGRLTKLVLGGLPLRSSSVLTLLRALRSLQDLTIHELTSCSYCHSRSSSPVDGEGDFSSRHWPTDESLTAIPRVCTLSGRHSCNSIVTETFLKSFVVNSPMNVYGWRQLDFLPQLQWFRLVVQELTAQTEFISLVKSRYPLKGDPMPPHVHRLRAVALHTGNIIDNTMLSKELDVLEKQGLMLTIDDSYNRNVVV